MKLTNKLNLPKPIFEAITNDSYTAGISDVTATSLIAPHQMKVLEAKHADEITEDAADRIYSLQGQSVHTILERAAEKLQAEGYVSERRFYLDVEGWVLGAQIDVFHAPTGLLQDYKVTSVYSVKDGPKEEYAKQMNIQAYLLRHGYELVNDEKVFHRHEVRALQVVAILRDWSKGELQRCKQNEYAYPEYQVAILDVPLIPEDEVYSYIKTRMAERRVALEGSTQPRCNKEERWAKDDVWAVMKKGNKRAVKLYYNAITTEDAVEAYGSGHYVEYRKGESTRCKSYCPVRDFCQQYKESK